MSLLTKDELRDAARRVGMIESYDGRTMRSIGQAAGLTVSDALAWAAEIERMVVAKLTGTSEEGAARRPEELQEDFAALVSCPEAVTRDDVKALREKMQSLAAERKSSN